MSHKFALKVVTVSFILGTKVDCFLGYFEKPKIVIVGGGAGGNGVAGMLRMAGYQDVVMIEPKDVLYYQPLWTLVGGGLKKVEDSARPLREVMSPSAKLIKNSVKTFDPDNNTLILADDSKVTYDYLVVATGLVNAYDQIPGLTEALDDKDSGVVSVYDYKYAEKTSHILEKSNGGRAIFTYPTTPFKCPGAAQKIMWLYEEKLRDKKIRDKATIEYWIPAESMFGIPKYAKMLTELADQRNIQRSWKKQLISVNPDHKSAVFLDLKTNEKTTEQFDILHAVPPMYTPKCLQESKLSNAAGYLEVDKFTLQSTKYPNVFGIGDCLSSPNGKTAAAATSQAPVVVHNLHQVINGQELDGKYDGYTSCPLVIGKNEVILAEFGYDGKILESFSPETGEFPYSLIGQEGYLQRRLFFWMKEVMFPFVYFNFWPRGTWFGSSGFSKPDVTGKGKKS